MLARQDEPIDTFSPDDVVKPLWHAIHPCDVSNRRGASLAWAAAASASVALESMAKKAAVARSANHTNATIGRAHGVRRGVVSGEAALPPREESTIEPVPEDIGDELARSRRPVANR